MLSLSDGDRCYGDKFSKEWRDRVPAWVLGWRHKDVYIYTEYDTFNRILQIQDAHMTNSEDTYYYSTKQVSL